MTEYAGPFGFTKREHQIYRMIVETAAPTREIAELLKITEETVKAHRHHILDKIGADSALEMVVWHYTKLKEQSEREGTEA